MSDPKKMSVADILAAARKQGAQGGEKKDPSPTPSEPPAAAPAEPATPASEATPAPQPAAPAAGAGKPGRAMSVAEMMAAARGEKNKPAPAAAPKAAPKPAAASKPAAAEKSAEPKKAEPKPAAAKGGAAPAALDTASILASVRSAAKPGPVSKGAAKESPAAPPAKKKGEALPMPEKPAYARATAPAPPAEGETRRGFLAAAAGTLLGSYLAVGLTTLTVTHVLWLLGLARFMFPNVLIEPPTKFKVGFPEQYAPGQVETKFIPQFGVWIVRSEYQGAPQIYALQAVCTHLGCTPNWLESEQKFKCPCHGSGFYISGINFEGPAPRPLERFAIRLAGDGQLEVDKSRTFLEEKGEWANPLSFIPV